MTKLDKKTRMYELPKKVGKRVTKTKFVHAQHLFLFHQIPIEVDDVMMTSSQSQLVVLLHSHLTSTKYIIIPLKMWL